MVDIDEVDDEGAPLRHDESKYIHREPPIWQKIIDTLRPLYTCWDYCHVSPAIVITFAIFSTICILGALVLAGNKDAKTAQFPTCNRLYSWVLYWVIINAINSVWYAIEEGFRVPALQLDPDSPNGVRETPLSQQNSMAYIYLRIFRLTVHFILTLVFFVVGFDIVKNSTCPGHRDLWLYFKVFWWFLVVSYGLICLLILCGGCVACCSIIQQSRQHATAAAAAGGGARGRDSDAV